MHYDSNCFIETYSVFCRNFEDHTTAAVGRHNWNEEAIKQMARDLAAPWQDLRSTLRSFLEDIDRLIEDLMDWAVDYLGKADVNLSRSDY